jgi:hypothetical protein
MGVGSNKTKRREGDGEKNTRSGRANGAQSRKYSETRDTHGYPRRGKRVRIGTKQTDVIDIGYQENTVLSRSRMYTKPCTAPLITHNHSKTGEIDVWRRVYNRIDGRDGVG